MTNSKIPDEYERNDSEVEEEKAIDKKMEKQIPFSHTKVVDPKSERNKLKEAD